jgi:phosphatidylserine decarboxylase
MIYRLHKEGKIYLAVTILVLLILGLASWIYPSYFTFGLLALVIFFLIVFLIFFRNPRRLHVVRDTELVLSPCDGKVVVIEKTNEQEYIKGEAIQVSIFMSPLNVHSNRSPVTGEVVYQKYHPGQYLVAWHPKSSELNERNTVVIKRKNHLVLVRQIAGKVARKIVWYTQTGATLARGEEFGFIKFGSRVDVFLPPETTILVKIGDTVKGGVTDIAHFKST